MSGGSWDYFTYKCQDAADRLENEKSPLRRAFGAHMQLIAKAMHDIEWADSGDTEKGSEREAIREALGDTGEIKEIEVLLQDGRRIIEALKELGA